MSQKRADASYTLSLHVHRGQHHAAAAKAMAEIAAGTYGRPLISGYLFDETITVVLVRSTNLFVAAEAGTELKDSADMAAIDDSIFEDAWNIFENQKDTIFSFTDCTTIALMEKEGIRNIAAFDKDFKKIKEINLVA